MKRYYFLVFVFVAVLGSLFLSVRSGVFNIKGVEIFSGSPELRKFVRKELSAQIGMDLWSLELERLSSDLLDKNKNLSSLGFKKQWPSTLRVYIEERRPLVQVFHEKELWLMDRAGVLFVSSQKALPIFWPLPEDKTMLLNILTWLEKDNSDFNGLSWDNDLGLLVIGKNKERIILGRQNFAVNWKKAQDSMKYLEKQQRFAKTIDATYNNRAVVSF